MGDRFFNRIDSNRTDYPILRPTDLHCYLYHHFLGVHHLCQLSAGQQGYLGFHTWGNPGALAPYLLVSTSRMAKFVGFWAVLIQAGFSYQGTELVGIAAGETERPRKEVPSVIQKTSSS